MEATRTWRNKGLVMLMALMLLSASCAALGQKGKPAAKAGATPPAANVLQKVEAQTAADGVTNIVITTAKAVTYTVYKLPDPTRIILDIPDTTMGSGVPASMAVNNGVVGDIQVVGAGEQNKPITRVVVTLLKEAEYDVNNAEEMLTLKVTSAPTVAVAPEMPAPPPMLGPPQELPGAEAAPLEAAAPAEVSPALLPEPATGSLPPAHKILDIQTQGEGNLLRVVVVADGAVGSVDAFTLPNPPRIVVDLIGLKSVYPRTRLDLSGDNVSTIRVGKHPEKVRLVLDLAGGRMLPYTSVRRGDQLILTIGEGAEAATPPAEAAPAPAPAIEAAPAEIVPTPGVMPTPLEAAPGAPEEPLSPEQPTEPIQPSPMMAPPMEAAPTAPSGVPVDVLGVDFDYTQEKSTIRIRTSDRPEYEVVANDRDLLISVRVKNASISAPLERSLDTSEFAGPVRMVSSYQWNSGSEKDVYVTLSLNFLPKYYVVRDGNDLLFIADNPKGGTGAPLRAGEAEYAAGPEGEGTAEGSEESDSAVGPGGAQYYGGVAGSVRRNYTGRVVYLDYQRINVVDALSLLAEVAGLNLVVSGDLKGTVSLKLEAVPWDQALDIILRTQKYGAVIRGNIMRVAPLAELEEEERKFQERKMQKKAELPLELRILFVSYAKPKDVAEALKYVLTPGRGRVEVDERTSSLLIWDIATNLDQIQTFVQRLDIETPQVLIEARIVEARANLTRDLGVNWGTKLSAGAATGNPTGVNFPSTVDVGVGIVDGATLSSDGVNNGRATGAALNAGQTAVGISLGSLTNAVNLDLLLKALEIEEKAKIVSSPRILTLDGNQAQISQGVSIPFSTTSAAGTKTEFIDANLKIQVTPHVTADRRIIMEVVASNNSPVTVPGAQGPGINKAEATTQILVKDGDTAVIGGIFVIEDVDTDSGVPWLMRVPFVGWMFRTRSTTRNRRELLIFITPRIVSGGPEYMQMMRSSGR